MTTANIASLPLAAGASPLRHLNTCGIRRRVARGDVLVREGERSESLWFVETGVLTSSVTAPSGRRGIIEIHPAGALAGDALPPSAERGAQQRTRDSSPNVADALPQILPELRAVLPSRLLVVSAQGLQRALGRDPALAEWFADRLSERLDGLARRLAASLTMPVTERLASLLTDLACEHGRRGPTGTLIELPLDQDTLAQMVGATRESINRAIRGLREEGFLSRKGRTYCVRMPAT